MIEERIRKYSDLLKVMLAEPTLPYSKVTPSSGPYKPGVYRVSRASSGPSANVYVGETTNLAERIYQHLMANRRASTLKDKLITRGGMRNEDAVKQFLRQECAVQYVVVADEKERIGFEHFAIAILHPQFND
jgi:excinuclease UvrABC nuclease subunit